MGPGVTIDKGPDYTPPVQRTYDVLGRTLELARADITALAVDAIVSSENSDLIMDRPDGCPAAT